MTELIYLGLGIAFGIIIMFNRKSYKEQMTYEQVDAQIRTELATYKNLTNSLKEDVAHLKRQLAVERTKHVKS
jgi:hypothetical protein